MTKKRIVYFDLLNIVACFCVICMHCNTMVHAYQPGMNWACGLVIEVVCFWAVPIFFMLSGANLMRYRDRYDTRAFFKKRLMRILVPFLAWSAIIYILRFGFENPSETFGLGEFASLLFTNGIESVYWFFFPLFALYLSMPILSLLANQKGALLYLVTVSLILQSTCPLLATLIGIPWNSALSLSVAGGYVIYAVLGYLVATTDIQKRTRIAIYCLGIACLMLRYVYTLVSSAHIGDVDRTFFDYLQITTFFPAFAVFLWFKQHDWGKKPNLEKFSKQIADISSCSFGIYLIHMLILREVVFSALEVSTLSIGLRTIGPILVYFACLGIVYSIKKIPGFKLLVP